MRTHPAVSLLFAIGLVGVAAGAALADFVAVYKDAAGATNTLFTHDGWLRVESSSGSEIMLFDGDESVMYVVNPDEKSYLKMTEADMAQMGQQVDAAMSQMQEQMEKMLENVPEDQRKMMEEKMAEAMKGSQPQGMMQGVEAPEISYEKMGESKTISGYACEGYVMKSDGKKTGEVWTTSLDALGLSRDDMKPFVAMTEFAESAASQFGASDVLGEARLFNPAHENFIGLPVRSVEKEGTSELVSLEKQDVDASKFEVPSGYTEKNMQDMMQGR